MPDPITELLDREDGSAGRVKADLRPPPNRLHYWPADELNKVLDWVVRASQWLGLSDGSTRGSVLRALRDLPTRDAPVLFEDFICPSISNDTAPAGGALVGTFQSWALSTSGGAGVLMVMPTTTGGSPPAEVWAPHRTIYTGDEPIFRARVQMPHAGSSIAWRIGMAQRNGPTDPGTSAMFSFPLGSNEVVCITASDDMGGESEVPTGISLEASRWYELEIRYVPGAVQYLVDGVLVHTETSPDASSDYEAMAPFYARAVTTVGAPIVYVDWFSISFGNVQR